MKRLLSILLLLGGCASASGQGGPEAEERAERQPPAPTATRVEVAEVTPSRASIALRVPGEVEGVRDAALASALGGYVERVRVEAGDQVRDGQALVAVDTQVYGVQREMAQARLDQAEADLRRAQQLEGTLPAAEIQQARTAAVIARAEVRAAGLRARRSMVSAPFAGYVASVEVEEGEVVSPGAPILRLVQLDPAVISLSVPDRDVVALRPGMEVRVHTRATGQALSGTVARIDPAADVQTRAFTVEVEVPNPERRLLPGMIATVELTEPVETERIVLPQHVLVTRLENNGVFVLEGTDAKWRTVELGGVVRNQVVIRTGLEAGERVIVTGHRELADGDEVFVTRSGVCCEEGRVEYGERR